MRYCRAGSVEEAVTLLSECDGDGRVLAGGTDVLVQLRAGVVAPDLLVDVKRIEEMRGVWPEDDGFRIGAAVTGAELGEHPEITRAWPGVAEAVQLIGSTQIQGRCTLGGNLCNASPAADSVPALIAAGAVARIAGPGGRRDVPVEDVVTGPGQTCLSKGELVVSVHLPARSAGGGDAYARFTPRTEMDIAVVGCGVNLTLDARGICTAARVSLGAVAARPLLVEGAASALVGTSLHDGALEDAAAASRAACSPIDDKRGTKEFRIVIAGVLTRRVALIAAARAKGSA